MPSNLPPPVNVSPVIKFFRYGFLISGTLYGALKLQTFKAIEASRAEEKARRRAERDERLAEEKRLAAERDFKQIVEIFTPPPKLHGIPKGSSENEGVSLTCGNESLISEELTPRCETSYETLYGNDNFKQGTETSQVVDDGGALGVDLYGKPLDLSADDDLYQREQKLPEGWDSNEDPKYFIKDFHEDLEHSEDKPCRIPPEA